MAAEDFQPRNRLTVAKEVVAEFVQRRTTDRVGLVIFAAQPLTKVPPTTDTAVLLRQLEDVSLGLLPDGTLLSVSLAPIASGPVAAFAAAYSGAGVGDAFTLDTASQALIDALAPAERPPAARQATVEALCSRNTRTPSRRRPSSTALSRGSEPLTA